MENKGIMETLVDSRIIFLVGEINEEMSNGIVAKLLYLDSINHEDITIYINSPGGSVVDGLAIIDTMNLIKSNVNTISIGTAASMAAVILACGNKRSCLPHSHIMIHQVYFGAQGTFSDVSIAYNNAQEMKMNILDILSKTCHKKISTLEKDCDRDFWMNASKALDYGIIDEIL